MSALAFDQIYLRFVSKLLRLPQSCCSILSHFGCSEINEKLVGLLHLEPEPIQEALACFNKERDAVAGAVKGYLSHMAAAAASTSATSAVRGLTAKSTKSRTTKTVW
eukprot:GHUV01020646.1.p1 GENE.GHUV01020646.1~~GHUV01020646.1.p1  ORF type:complete len:107 (+),score=19.17 GHUV01020646.1:340-660(+)